MAEEQRTKGTGAMPEAIAAASADGYLGNIETVGQLVEDFATQALAILKPADREASKAAATALCQRYARIFTGADPAYPAPEWNTGTGLYRHLRNERLVEGGSPTQVLELFFAGLVASLWAAVGMAAEGVPDDAWQFQIDAAKDDAVRALLGLPGVEDDA